MGLGKTVDDGYVTVLIERSQLMTQGQPDVVDL